MTADQKTSTTMIWLKQLTTSTFANINEKIDRVEIVRRNKKILFILAVVWIGLMVAGHLLFGSMGQKRMDAFLAKGAAAAVQLAEGCGPHLLEGNVLELSRKVAEFTDERDALFTAILDHENRIMGHSDPEQMNRIAAPLADEKVLRTLDGVNVLTGRTAEGRDVVTFGRDITYSGVVIGRVIYGLPAEKLEAVTGGMGTFRLLFILLVTLGCGLTAFWTDRSRRRIKAPPAAGAMDGSTIGPYRLREKIAQGGMAELYMADYVRGDGFRRSMAVKRVLPHLAENQDFINMFIREARLAALLQHPNIVQIFDFGKIKDAYFIAMEFIDGLNLGQMMSQLKKGLPVNVAIFVAIKISLGLDYSHKRKDDETDQPLGIVHRDISPQNILVSFQGEVKISDFGISKANTEPSLTQAGVIKGKLSYLSPEQALGQPVDHQCDIYALGLVIYEILTASRVYQFDTDIEAIRTIPEMEIDPIRQIRPDVPEGLQAIIQKCLNKDKAHRYQDARDLHDDLIRLKAELQIPFDASDLSNFMRETFRHG